MNILKSVIFLLVVFLVGCSTINYEKTSSDGVKESISYARFGTAGADSIVGTLNDGSSINVQGQKGIDPELLKAILQAIGAMK